MFGLGALGVYSIGVAWRIVDVLAMSAMRLVGYFC